MHNVEIGETIVVSELCPKMAIKVREVVKMLMKMGELVRENESIDQKPLALLVEEMGHNQVLVSSTQVEDSLREAVGEKSSNVKRVRLWLPSWVTLTMVKRPYSIKSVPVKSGIGQAGGITQHIGAYHVQTTKVLLLS